MTKTHEKPTILIVDDDPLIRQAVTGILKNNYEVATAHDVPTAVARAQQLHPDLVILDVDLGRGNGILLCYQLRSNSITADIPIIMLTGFADSPTKQLAFQAGADDYVEKPVLPDELLDRISSKLRRWEEMRKAVG